MNDNPRKFMSPRGFIHGSATRYEANGGTGYANVCPKCRDQIRQESAHGPLAPDGLPTLHSYDGGHVLDFTRPIEDTGEDCDFCGGDNQ